MKLPEIKNSHLFLMLIILITVFGTFQIINQKKQMEIMNLLLSSNKGTDKEDLYEKSVKNQIFKFYPEIKKLYREYKSKNPANKEGSIFIDWTIDTNGKAVKPQIITSDLKDQTLENGIINIIEKIDFPEPPVRRYISHTFKFKETNEQSEVKK